MLATPHRLRSSALLASLLFATLNTAFAAEPADDAKALKQQLTDLTNQQTTNNAALQGQLKTIGDKLESLRTSLDLSVQANTAEITALKKQMEKLQSDVLTIQRQIESMPSHESRKVTANSPSAVSPVPVPTVTPKGRIQITNQYSAPIDYVINGMSYPVPSGQSLTLEYPAGATFTYSVLQIPEPARTRALRENETLMVTVTPRS